MTLQAHTKTQCKLEEFKKDVRVAPPISVYRTHVRAQVSPWPPPRKQGNTHPRSHVAHL